MKSHVQIPKSILKNFAYKSGKDGLVVDYLDLSCNEIKTEKINKLDTIEGYYSEEFDKRMGEKYETPFGDISKRIRDFNKNKLDKLSLSERETKTILDFYNNIFFRGKFALEKANKYSLTSVVRPIEQEELIILTRENLFTGNWVNIIRNKTNIDFVIPRNCFYVKKSKSAKKPHYILPITPKSAIILIPKEEIEEFETTKGTRDHYSVDDENTIKTLNEFALEIEKGTNNMFVVGNKLELSRLKKLL
ncbi:MAG: DUF4238 domain-containing protein [Candidatus Marinimicrobia bacterium]|nr:DUF4238 domain-containing protein [Candidatus Neomarinimicrobiota bacterium]